MKIKLVTIGNRLPAWVNQAVNEYSKRLSSNIDFQLIELSPAKRTKNTSAEQCKTNEAIQIRNKIESQDYCIALDEKGKTLSTGNLADRLQGWIDDNRQITFIIGGADGIDTELQQQANEIWSLSALTMPHGLARIVLIEQLYRAHSILLGHPYHRI